MDDNSVLVFGSIAYDCIETPFDKADYILGGSASYAALACSFFAPTKILGVVGNDFNENDIKRLTARNIDVSGIEVKNEGKTFFWRGKYHSNFNRRDTLEVSVNVYGNYAPTIPESLKTAPYLLLGNIDPNAQKALLDSLEKPKFTVLDTMNLWIEIANKTLRDLFPRIDLLIINEDEAMQLADESNLLLCGDIIKSMGVKTVIIKKGEHGSMLFHDDGFYTMPAYPVRALHDPTGAGDSYSGALLGYIAKTGKTDFGTIKKAIVNATAVASTTVESFSCYKLEEAGLAEIEKRIDYLKEITSV